MKLLFSKQAEKDWELIKRDKTLLKRARILLEIIETDPFQTPPEFEKLVGEARGAYSRRINLKHRLVYRVVGDEVWILTMWSHYEKL
jgi:Txe/YoeB family toxin of toxin-antitoxin system